MSPEWERREHQLGPQLWVDWIGSGRRPGPSIIRPAADRELDGKPDGGLWTSPLIESGEDGVTSPYVERQREVMAPMVADGWPQHQRSAWRIDLPEQLALYEVSGREAELDLVVLAPSEPGDGVVWKTMAEKVDGVWMTEAGVRSFLQIPSPSDPRYEERMRVAAVYSGKRLASPLDWWDAESVWWPRWVQGMSATHIGEITVPQIDQPAR